MFSRKNTILRIFETLILGKVIFLSFMLFYSSEAQADQRLLKIREFKYSREIHLNEGSILIDKKTLDLLFLSKNRSLKVIRRNDRKTSTFQVNVSKATDYLVESASVQKKKMLGYLSRDYQVQYQSEICSQNFFTNNIEKIISPKLISSIRNLEIIDLFDKKSCKNLNPERFEEFKKVLIGTLAYKQGEILKCSQSETARKFFLEDPALLENANEAFGR